MAELFKISVDKDYLVFAAAHFITYDGMCEALHGHNYRARIELEGTLDENAFVFDFIVLKSISRRLVDELDHKTLIPLENPLLTVDEEGGALRVRYPEKEREYLFPREDVVLLPIPNTTAEMLARYLSGRLVETLREQSTDNLTTIAVEIEESFGQSAYFRRELRS